MRATLMVAGAAGVAVGLGAPAAVGQTRLFHQGAVTASSAVWSRPLPNGSGPSGHTTGVVAFPFYVNTAGSFELRSSQSWDAVIYLYRNGFDPASPLTNYVAGNDDDHTGPWLNTPGPAWTVFSRIPPTPLTAGTQYYFVTSSFAAFSYGSFANEINGPGVIVMALVGEPTGSCVRPDNSCITASAAFCASQGGTYLGNGSVCPQPGACCLTDGTCTPLLAPACAAQGGLFRGDGAPCATANCPQPPGQWGEAGDAGPLPATANIPVGTGALTVILGTNGADDADVFKIRVATPGSFSASTVSTGFDTQLFLFNAAGLGVVCNDDFSGTLSTITNQFVTAPGDYYLAITRYNKDAVSPLGLIFGTATSGQVGPTGPGASQPVSGWSGAAGGGGAYRINLSGCVYPQAPANPCYANCDGSTTLPVLNVSDFGCFLTRYAAGEAYANCDGSTAAPVLNVSDFGCFLTKYAAGCR